MTTLEATGVWRDVAVETFRDDIRPRYRPALLKGLVADWPSVRTAAHAPEAILAYVSRFDLGRPVETFVGDPTIQGRFWYQKDMRGLNFERRRESFAAFASRLTQHLEDERPPAIYMGAASIAEGFPEFAAHNPTPLVDHRIVPRLWMGNAVEVATHYDIDENLACVVAGRRRFTLFPPDQLPNLYVGPLDFTLAGQPSSLVPLDDPDPDRFPRFAEALAAAQVAELEAGDALYIPPLWWHHVESLDRVNALVNYWWTDAVPGSGSPFECLVHAILTIRSMPEPQRAMWRKMFDHYIFETGGDPVAHLPPEHRGILGRLTPQLANYIRTWLQRAMTR
jgi:hypothetical protein